MASHRRIIYSNPEAKPWSFSYTTDISLAQSFHQRLHGFKQARLVPLDDLAQELGVRKVFVKDESSRLGLPSFKILGASWGTFRAVADKVGSSVDSDIRELSKRAREGGLKLFAATDGNHGRAVARMAAMLQIEAEILVPRILDCETRRLIGGEGAKVTSVDGDYDTTVLKAFQAARANPNGILVQDTSLEGDEEIPGWIVEGYSTMLQEIETQLAAQGLEASVLVTPVGVGSLAQAVVSYSKADGRSISTLAVEPDTAACLHESLKSGKPKSIKTGWTIMAGMNCGTVSPVSWPILRNGVDASVTISDHESDVAVRCLVSQGINAGPCGAATLAALRRVATEDPAALSLCPGSVVVLLSTEGTRPYKEPADVSSSE